jgi:hypothetical protein
MLNKIFFLCAIVVFYSNSFASSVFENSIDHGRNLLALTSTEVKEMIGVYKSNDDVKNISLLTLKRANEACHYYDADLVDFSVKGEDKKQYVNIVQNEQISSIEQNDKLDFLTISADVGLFIITGGLSAVTRIGTSRAVKTLGIEAGIMGGLVGIQEMVEDANLTDIWSYNYLIFSNLTCIERNSETKEKDLLNYACRKNKVSSNNCREFDNIHQVSCFKQLQDEDYSNHKAIALCKEIKNKGHLALMSYMVEEDEDDAPKASKVLKDLTEAQALVFKANLENYRFNYSKKMALKIQNMAQAKTAVKGISEKNYKPSYVIENTLKIRNNLQAELAIAGMESFKPHTAISYAVEKELTIPQAKVAIFAMEKGYYPSYVIPNAQKVENEFQALVAIAGMKTYKPALAIDHAIKDKWTPYQVKVAVHALNNKWYPWYVVPEALKIENELQAQVAIAGMKVFKPEASIRYALTDEWTKEQARVAIHALSLDRDWYPSYVIPEALKVENENQADKAIKNMKKWKPAYAIKKAIEEDE